MSIESSDPHTNRRRELQENMRKFYKEHRATRYMTELALKAGLVTFGFMAGGIEGAKTAKDPEVLMGMIEGAMIAPKLAIPDEATASLSYREAPGGRFLAYDFNRAHAFPAASKKPGFTQTRQGRMMGFLPDEVKGNPKTTHTPLGLLNLLSINHLLTMDRFTPADLIDLGLVDAVSQAEAFERVGQGHFIPDLRAMSLDNDPVYQVTPKGNTLVKLFPDNGARTPKKEPETGFDPAFTPEPKTV